MPPAFDNWPTWLLFGLIVINIFKQQIGAFFPTAIREHFQHKASRQVNREEYGQLRESWREEQWVDMLNRRDAWIQNELATEIKALKELSGQTNSLLREVNGNLAKLVDLTQEQPTRPPWVRR